MNEYLEALKQYSVFEGRASRREYWMFTGISLLIAIVLGIVDAMVFGETPILGILYTLAILVPSLAVSVRRLHDTNRSGWWLFIIVIPIIGVIVLFVFALQASQNEGSRYGAVTEPTRTAEQTLADFIAQSRVAGQTDEQIKLVLSEKGWSYRDIMAGLNGNFDENKRSEIVTLKWKARIAFLISLLLSPAGLLSGMAFDAPGSEHHIWPYIAVLFTAGPILIGFIASTLALLWIHIGMYHLSRIRVATKISGIVLLPLPLLFLIYEVFGLWEKIVNLLH